MTQPRERCLPRYFFKKIRVSIWILGLVGVAGFEPTASTSQMCVGTFSHHSTVLCGPFLCLGGSSLELFRPACFKKTFRLLGFVWDWILCIKRCSARFEGQWQGKLPLRSGAGIAPHKQRIRHSLQVAWKVNSFYHAAAPKTTGAYAWR